MADVRIGDVSAYIDYGDGEEFLGETLGGAEFSVNREFVDLLTDRFGTAPLDKVLTGNDLMVKLYLAEPTNENMSRAIPEGTYNEGTGGDSKLTLGSQTGKLLSNHAGLLRLHPRTNDESNRNEDIYIWKAVSMESIELPFKIDEQRVLEVTFQALVDTSKPDGEHLGRIGDFDIS
jgi:hypothetical protein